MFGHVKNVVRELIDISLVLIALAIVLSILVGGTMPFFGRSSQPDSPRWQTFAWLGGPYRPGIIMWLVSARGTAAARK
jgi:hypothetical protein